MKMPFMFQGLTCVDPCLMAISDDTKTVGLIEQFLALRVGY